MLEDCATRDVRKRGRFLGGEGKQRRMRAAGSAHVRKSVYSKLRYMSII